MEHFTPKIGPIPCNEQPIPSLPPQPNIPPIEPPSASEIETRM